MIYLIKGEEYFEYCLSKGISFRSFLEERIPSPKKDDIALLDDGVFCFSSKMWREVETNFTGEEWELTGQVLPDEVKNSRYSPIYWKIIPEGGNLIFWQQEKGFVVQIKNDLNLKTRFKYKLPKASPQINLDRLIG